MALTPADVRPGSPFYLAVQRLEVDGVSIVHKFGRNDAVPNGSWAFLNLLGLTSWPLSAATAVRVKLGNAADAFDGNGAREVTIQGLDETGVEVREAVATGAGGIASAATETTFIRVHRAWVSGVGVYGAANTGDVVIENAAGGTNLIKIAAGEGQSQFAGFTVPLGHEAFLASVHIDVDAGANKVANVRMFQRRDILNTTAPMSSRRIKLHFDGIVGSTNLQPATPGGTIPALTDVWFEGWGDGAISQVSVDFELILVKTGVKLTW